MRSAAQLKERGEEPGLPWPFDFRGFSPSRPGFVLDFKNGALPLMALPYRFFIGGPIGSGKQWFPWIHLDDVVELIMLALEDEQLSGADRQVFEAIVGILKEARHSRDITLHRRNIIVLESNGGKGRSGAR